MRQIECMPGDHIETVARKLVAHAPARAMFNDIPIRAKYATTCAADVVREYNWRVTLRGITYQHSAAGKAARAKQEAARAAAQAAVNAHVMALESLDMNDAPAVLAWIEGMVDPADHIGLTYDHDAVTARFSAAGWLPGANTDGDFDEKDARNFAGWIVGQWLASRWPGVVRFIQDWRQRFAEPVN